MKKLIASSVIASATLFPIFVNAEKFEFPSRIEVEQKIEIRKGATDAYPIVTQVPKGQNVTILSEFKNAFGETWYNVDLGNIKGWSPAGNFSKAENTQSTNKSFATVTSNNVNVRKGATTSYAVSGKLSKGQRVEIIDKFINNAKETWYRIEYGALKGWVISSYLTLNGETQTPEPAKTETVLVDKAPVKKGATDAYATVQYLEKNQKVTIIDTFKNASGELWYRVDLGSLKGWVNGTAFHVTEPPAPNPVPEDKPPATSTKLPKIDSYIYGLTDSIAIRDGSSTSHSTVGYLAQNQEAKVLDHYTGESGENWVKIELNDSTIGWIPNNDIELTEEINKVITINVDVANIRSGPSTSRERVTQATKGTKLTSVGKLGEWYNVILEDGKNAWAHVSVITEQLTNITKFISSDSASVRSGATTQYRVIETLKKNSPVTVLQYFTNALNEQWLQVKTQSGKTGWVLETQTTLESTFKLTSPSLNGQTLSWKKPSGVNIKYEIMSNNRLRVYGDFGLVEKPDFAIPGINSVETNQSSLVLTFDPGYTFTLRNNTEDISIKIIPTGLTGKKIIIDAGHGAHDSGAVGPSGTYEKDVNLATALKLKAELENAGAIVLLTRSTDVFLELAERTNIANSSDFDAFVSIHADSFSSTSKGTTTYINTTVNFNGIKSKFLADSVQKNLIQSLGTYNRGVKEQSFYVNRMNALPSILVELAFISNPNEEALLKSAEFQQKAATGIKKGLEEYFSNF